jgi:UDP:flavonoid glycosyltransferase YjiC (YdhE family)
MVPLARAFVDRGHDVAWVTGEDACARLRGGGFDAIAAGPAEGAALGEFHRRFPEAQSLAPPDRPEFMFPRLFGTVRAGPMLTGLLPIARAWKPSLLVSDQAELAGPIAAAALEVPGVTHAFGRLLPANRVAAAATEVAPLWERHGLEPRPFAGTYDHLYLDIYPPSLQAPGTTHVGDIQPIRPVTFAAGGNGAPPDWLHRASPDPLVYVTFGTVFNQDVSVIATVVQALRELPLRVVVTLGPGREPGLLGPQPPNVHVASYIAQTDVVPHCAAVASHAGSGTFLAALARGLPQLLMPQAADQFLNADAGVGAGAGIAVQPHELTVERVRDGMERLLGDPTFRAAAGRLRTEIEAMPPPDAVVETIERRLGADPRP